MICNPNCSIGCKHRTEHEYTETCELAICEIGAYTHCVKITELRKMKLQKLKLNDDKTESS